MMEKTLRSSRLDYLKAAAAVLVVLGHALTYINNTASLEGFWKALESLIYAVHVPLFFAVAGYLCHRQPLGSFYKKKLLRIFVPFLTFTVLKLLYSVAFSGQALSAGLLKDAFIYGTYYWFCYAILLMFVLAPLMWKRGGEAVSVIILIICLVLQVVFTAKGPEGYGPFQVVQIVYCYPFFFAGYWFRQYMEKRGEKAVSGMSVKIPALIIGAAAVSVYLYIDMNGMDDRLFYFPCRTAASIALIAGAAALSGLIPEGVKTLSFLGGISLQIMLFDSLYKILLFKVAERIGWMHPAVSIPITVIDILLIAVTYILIRKLPYIRTLFGIY